MRLRVLRSILLLPVPVLILVPAVLLWRAGGASFFNDMASPLDLRFWLGLGTSAAGLVLVVWTVRLQVMMGEGTPAPWDPTVKLVVRGAYRYVRNPMITGVFCILGGEALLLADCCLVADLYCREPHLYPLSGGARAGSEIWGSLPPVQSPCSAVDSPPETVGPRSIVSSLMGGFLS